MSGGFIRIFNKENEHVWLAIRLITKIKLYPTYDDYMKPKYKNTIDPLQSTIKCKCTAGNCIVNETLTCIRALFPIYCVKTDGKEYLVEFSQYEKLERILEGTDNPMYDFVHELRYNPNSFMKGRELQEAEKDFEVNKKIKK
jgi:hypothetical protein